MWEKLAKKVKDVPNLVIGEMDATTNDAEDISIKLYPTIIMFSKDHKQGEEYLGERDVDSIV